MTHRDEHNSMPDGFEQLLNEQLQRAEPAPDLTRRVMGRLGYMQVKPAVARQHRRRRVFARSGVVVAGLLAVGIGIVMHNSSPQARRPMEMTLPAAAGQDLESSQQRMGDMFRSLRMLTPSFGETTGEPREIHRAPSESPAEDAGTPQMDDAINRSAIAPMRWV